MYSVSTVASGRRAGKAITYFLFFRQHLQRIMLGAAMVFSVAFGIS